MTIIRPKKGLLDIDFREIWNFRELFFFLVWRDIKVKYKQSALGALWAIIVPFLQMVIFTVLFGRVAKLPTDGVNPAVFYYSGLLIWTYFSTSLTFSSSSLVSNKNLLTKIYFPRLIMPMAPTLAALLDFIIAFSILIVMIIYYGTAIDFTVLLLPLFVIMAMITASGTGFLFSALNVKYRDIGFALPFITQIWMYGTVIVPFSSIPHDWGIWRYLYGLNPMAGIVEGFRWCMLHLNLYDVHIINKVKVNVPLDFPYELLGIGIVSMIIILLIGLSYFRKMEDTFADIV
jgi:lipopolysaccharide transport system permease protein